MILTDEFLNYISAVRRYSPRTVQIYEDVLREFSGYAPDADVPTASVLRSYEVWLMDDRKECARSVCHHMSVLSSYCKFLVKRGKLEGNPARLVSKPKTGKRLPLFYRRDSMNEYFDSTEYYVSVEFAKILREQPNADGYEKMLRRLVVGMLHGTGLRRAELIGLNFGGLDEGRQSLRVRGKGDKEREIPLTDSLFRELSLYLSLVSDIMGPRQRDSALLCSWKGERLYPVWVDRAVKKELACVEGITGRKSPHVLRHTLASELLDAGTDLNSIKELLGHSSLAATQVYTHSTVERLKKVYENAHPRARSDKSQG